MGVEIPKHLEGTTLGKLVQNKKTSAIKLPFFVSCWKSFLTRAQNQMAIQLSEQLPVMKMAQCGFSLNLCSPYYYLVPFLKENSLNLQAGFLHIHWSPKAFVSNKSAAAILFDSFLISTG